MQCGKYGPHHQGFGLKLGHGSYDDHSPYGTSGGTVYYDHGPPHYSSGRKSGKGSGALSALTLLAFLFFLNLLQSCLKEHMDAMNPTVMVMTAGSGREQMETMVFEGDHDGVEFSEGNATNMEEFSAHEHFVELPRLVKHRENTTNLNVYLRDYSTGDENT
uniref:Uncharacterized protein n=1 Tax=Phlebotomus papatasi TaxID=29031 RepID=A0A1B0DF25_PHLPP